MIHTLEKMAEHKIMSKRFLRNLKMEKKDMIKLLSSRLAQTADRTGSGKRFYGGLYGSGC